VVDFMTPAQRSRAMSCVRSQGSTIERQVRSLLHTRGFRFRKNTRHLPGSPDLTLPKYTTAIFIHGCFWHGHTGCKKSQLPTTRAEFWHKKIVTNQARDKQKIAELFRLQWRVVVIWGCALSNSERISCTFNTFEKWLHTEERWCEIS
jgi:DNA mismatch endonuclease (patch repair protein)